MVTFKKLIDSPECDLLFERYPDAFILMTIIAKKAMQDSRTATMGIAKGQSFIGDYKKFGLTESKYRKAKKQLMKFGFASFRVTNRGTIATILDTRIYDINTEPENGQTAFQNLPGKNQKKIKKPDNFIRKPFPNIPGTGDKIKGFEPDLNVVFKGKAMEPLKFEIPSACFRKRIGETPGRL